ncbi:MAG: SMP-30/gluconolactonase/LRE family protein [Novosphingobium sp.]
MRKIEVIAEHLAFPEGPVVMADGSVILVEIMGKRVTRCWGHGRKEVVAEPGGGPNGAAIGPDGALYVCNSGGMGHDGSPVEVGRIERIDLGTGKVERLYDSCQGKELGAPNDLMFDCDGNMWFTDLGNHDAEAKYFGGLYCARPDGSSITRIFGKATSYNGVGISPDMTTVYTADTFSARVYAFDRRIEEQQPRWLATAPGPVMLDSLAMAASGNVCVATLMPGAITTVTPTGDVSTEPLDDRLVTNIAFGGADMMDAWITFSDRGALVKTRWSEPGMKLIYNA